MARRPNASKRSRKRKRSGTREGADTAGAKGASTVAPEGATNGAATTGPSGGSGGRPGSEPRSGYGRSEAKNAAAREALVPLREDERPAAVTVAVVVAVLLAGGNIAAYFTGFTVAGERPSPLLFTFPALLLVAAVGMWKMRYWAVLGMQAVLALVIIGFSLNVLAAFAVSNVLVLLLSVVIAGAAGTLFWFLVKAMARIQMPERR